MCVGGGGVGSGWVEERGICRYSMLCTDCYLNGGLYSTPCSWPLLLFL